MISLCGVVIQLCFHRLVCWLLYLLHLNSDGNIVTLYLNFEEFFEFHDNVDFLGF